MRASLITFLLGMLIGVLPVMGQETVVQALTGTTNTTTPKFTVQDKWEIRWGGQGIVKLAVFSADGTLVSGGITSNGALYMPKGGTYYLQISMAKRSDEFRSPNANIAPGNGPGSGLQRTLNDGLNGNDSTTNAPPRNLLPPTAFVRSWSFKVIQLGQTPQEGVIATFFNPAFDSEFTDALSSTPPTPVVASTAPATGTLAASATPPASTPAPEPAGKLTADQARAVVLISGDEAVGTGFLVKTADGPCVITNIHVISANPNLKITTSTGAEIKMLSAKGAVDRDLAMLMIQDAGYNYLELADDVSKVAQPGDEVITPGNSEGGGVMLPTTGKVLGIGPDRVEVDNPIFHGNSGGPVFHTKSNKVLGVVTEARKVDVTNDLDKASHANKNSAISGTMRYFALRLDNVSSWVPIDWRRFQNETTFMEQFHKRSRCLDSFLNTSDKTPPPKDSDALDPNLWRTDDKLEQANTNYIQQASGGDSSQRLDAERQLLADLVALADTDVSTVKDLTNFYSFNRDRAKDEMAYRKALQDELDDYGNNMSRAGGMARKND